MKSQINVATSNNKQKVVMIYMLFVMTVIIMLLGISFSIFSLINNVSFKVINSSVHGAIFGILVTYLGAKYFISVTKLKTEIFNSTSNFSWENFKRIKNSKKIKK